MYRRILLTLDGDPSRRAAARHALDLAAACGAEVLVMSAVKLERRANRTASGVAVTETNTQLQLAQEQLARVVSAAERRGVRATSYLVEMVPSRGILKMIDDHRPDLVVMTPHSETILGLPISRTTLRVVRGSSVPVLLVREERD
ncbi:universal stress protein [Deinococcus aquiradiocola]|uniref:Universal stress protein n=1 Tax=Deinococcus aquiradiocola TaxID=393059 RepID=A0A917UK45_9DEIO|nr:universal stress protein [Deinococcus aquiradiocola]GGJ63182.1 universal stress protein [Deinococcus aquiradiocola]